MRGIELPCVHSYLALVSHDVNTQSNGREAKPAARLNPLGKIRPLEATQQLLVRKTPLVTRLLTSLLALNDVGSRIIAGLQKDQ